MNYSSETIDKIVQNVLKQLNTHDRLVEKEATVKAVSPTRVQHRIIESVITADILEPLRTGELVYVSKKAIITPAANDLIRERNLIIERTQPEQTTHPTRSQKSTGARLKISAGIVRHTQGVQQSLAELGEINTELLSCPDDAAKYAISELCRTGVETVMIFAEQTYRAACLANRNSIVKAVAINHPGDVKIVRKQIRANVWCIDPTNCSYFELKNLLKSICQP